MLRSDKELYEFADFRLDVSERLLMRKGKRVSLSEKAFEILCLLARESGHLVGKDKLLAEVWADAMVEENNLDKNISLLRQVLGERKGRKFIETVRGHGYRFVADVRRLERLEEEPTGKEPRAKNSIATSPSPVFAVTPSNNVVALADWRHEPEAGKSTDETISTPAAVSELPVVKRKRYFWISAIIGAALILAIGILAFAYLRPPPVAENAAVKTLAVLPFKPLVAENRNESLEFGMADTLINKLSESGEIVVRPLGSVRKFNNLEQDSLAAGRALGVDSILEGNIQILGERIRVTARLIRTADGKQLWTGQFDENFDDIFVVQDSISEKVANALTLQLDRREQQRLTKRQTTSPEAYELYLRGRYSYFKLTEPEIRRSIDFYQRAIDLDPNYALAYAGIADAYRTLPIAGWKGASKDGFPQAKAFARKALAIDPDLAEARIVLGWAAFSYDWDWQLAESELKKAIALAPNDAGARRAYAHLYSITGRHEEAVAEGRRARELDPLSLITNALEAQFLFYAGRESEAEERLKKTLEIEPDFWIAHNGLGRVYLHEERFDEAIAAFNKARELSGGGSVEPIAQLGYTFAKSGKPREARAILEELKTGFDENYVPAYNLAVVYNGLGDSGEALNYLEKSFEQREVQLIPLKIDTRWDNLRAEPRFIELMKRMNFE